ncbi:MAG TPA: DUF6600 domain-containing protein [Paludibacter sp.]|nr:DUF6600 domain-containing protein [Paludibacter sp.]
MKSHAIIIAVLVIVSVSCAVRSNVVSPRNQAYHAEVNFQLFYDELNPYGDWVDYPPYGYVWIPDLRGDFMPYSTNGYWVYTDYGWTWVSDYRWGWAPFHYGRWGLNNDFGWFWVPGNEWGPAWVNWRQSRGYYGWSPLQPGMSNYSGFRVQNNIAVNYWVFVRERDLTRKNIDNYRVDRNEYDHLIRNSTVVRNTYRDNNRLSTYVSGPRRADIQRATGQEIRRLRVSESDRPGQDLNKESLRIYKPRVERGHGTSRGPEKVISPADVRRGNTNNRDRRLETDQDMRMPDNRPYDPVMPARGGEDMNRQNTQPTPARTPDNRTDPGRRNIDQNNRNIPRENNRETGNPQNVEKSRPAPNQTQPNNNRNVRPRQDVRVPKVKPDKNRDIIQPRDQTKPKQQPLQLNKQKPADVRQNNQPGKPSGNRQPLKNSNRNTKEEQPRKQVKQDDDKR